jgi:hypothetical protein
MTLSEFTGNAQDPEYVLMPSTSSEMMA